MQICFFLILIVNWLVVTLEKKGIPVTSYEYGCPQSYRCDKPAAVCEGLEASSLAAGYKDHSASSPV